MWLFKRLAASVAVAVLLTFVPTAQADPIVEFSVDGMFNVGTHDSASLSNGGSTVNVGTTSLSFSGVALTFDLGQPEYASSGGIQVANVSFGTLSLASDDPNGEMTREKKRAYDGIGLTLNFTQVLPIAGSHEVVTKLIHGTVWYSETDPDNGTGSYLSITFAEPLVFTIPESGPSGETITYKFLAPKVRINNPDGTGSSSTTIGGQVSAAAAPLPGVAWAGLALMGGFGGLRRLRRARLARSVIAVP